MRTEEELKTQQVVPDGSGDTGEHQEGSPFRRFFEAIEDLEIDRERLGPTSLEAHMTRVRVDRMREAAVAAWREKRAAA